MNSDHQSLVDGAKDLVSRKLTLYCVCSLW